LAVILKATSGGEDLMINAWNWRPTVALLVREGIIPPGEREERCLSSGCGGRLSAAEAFSAAECIDGFLAAMQLGHRLRVDGTVTDRPINRQLPISDWDDREVQERYSIGYDVLKMIAVFCRHSGGFVVR
jgi:hypothetical protein